MVSLERPLKFQWDEGNARKSADKHGVSQAEGEQVFFNEPLLLLDDQKHSLAEPRYYAFGKTDGGRALLVCFTLRRHGAEIRIISARDMSRGERKLYAEEA